MGKTCNLSSLSPEAVVKLLHEIHPLVLYVPHIKPFNGPCSIYALSNCNTWLSTKSHVTELQSLGILFRLLVYHIYKYYSQQNSQRRTCFSRSNRNLCRAGVGQLRPVAKSGPAVYFRKQTSGYRRRERRGKGKLGV